MLKRTLKCMLAVALTVAALAGPVRQAQAADLAFPILFVPIYSQDEIIAGGLTDTRITVFNPSRHCPVAFDPDCVGAFAALPAGTHLRIFWFDQNERFITESSFPMTPFDVVVVTAPSIPHGTGTAILVNTFAGLGAAVPAFAHPIAAVTEIGAKTGPVGFVADGQAAGQAGQVLFAVSATEAQLIPAFSGEFPRVEVSAGPAGAAILFGPDFETVIVETCLFPGAIDNFVLDSDEHFLFDTLIPCTGFGTPVPPGPAPFPGPDLLIWTPDDGGLLGTGAAAAPGGVLAAGYNRLAIDADSFTAITLFYGQAIVLMPIRTATGDRQAYSYNMPANFFFTSLQAPAQNEPTEPCENPGWTGNATTSTDQTSIWNTTSCIAGRAQDAINDAINGICEFPPAGLEGSCD